METNIIEFCGELSDQYKKYFIKTAMKMLWSIVLGVFVIICVPIIILCIIFAPLYVTIPLAVIFIFTCLTAPTVLKSSLSLAKLLPVKVIIENDEIVSLNSAQVSQLNPEFEGIESLNVDGYYIADPKPISDIVKIVDYGEWYGFFGSLGSTVDYVCQKNLITRGTIEEFEKLFEGKIERRKLNSK